MLKLILENMKIIGFGIALLMLSFLSNLCFSMYYNISLQGKKFSKEKLIKGLLKVITISIGLVFLIIVITVIPIYCQLAGLEISEQSIELINIVALITAFIKPTLTYTKEALGKLDKLLKFNKDD